jgi:hypothetical protein
LFRAFESKKLSEPDQSEFLFFEITFDGVNQQWGHRQEACATGLFERKYLFHPPVASVALSTYYCAFSTARQLAKGQQRPSKYMEVTSWRARVPFATVPSGQCVFNSLLALKKPMHSPEHIVFISFPEIQLFAQAEKGG